MADEIYATDWRNRLSWAEENNLERKCPRCDTMFSIDYVLCPNCGHDPLIYMIPAPKTNPKAKNTYCPYCGGFAIVLKTKNICAACRHRF